MTNQPFQQATANASPLLDLPPEVRNRIYELVFEDAGDLKLRLMGGANARDKSTDDQRQVKPPPRLSLFMTCKQIRSETLGLVYSKFRLSVKLPPDTSAKVRMDAMRDTLLAHGDPYQHQRAHLSAMKRLGDETESILQDLFAALPERIRPVQ